MLKQFIQITIFLIIFIAVFITTTYLAVYFFVKNEESVVIPDIYGKDIIYVLELLSDNALNTKVEGTEYHSTIPKNHVIYQDPKPGSEVKVGRDVKIILSKGSKWLTLPDIRGVSIEKAYVLLDANRLCSGEVTQIFHPYFESGMIIAQYPEPGTYIAHNACINFLVSRGNRFPLYQMPDFTGVSFENALISLNKIDIKPVSIKYASDTQWPENRIIEQNPLFGASIAKDEPILLTVNRRVQNYESLKGGVSLFIYTVPNGFLRKQILVRLNIFGVTIHVYDNFFYPSEQIFVIIPNDCDASVFVYQDDELVESQIY
ncbi:MAG: PASTA domain-containing protein [Candidatus Magnetomorum sp.]|nr:PASTA domain-containing protein [Candidatus Magnetomorum sp.]